MVIEARRLNISDLPGLEEIVREANASGRPVRIVQNGEELAILQPAKKPRRTRLQGRPVTADDPFLSLAGIGRSSGPGDISANKTEYLVKALKSKYE